jgi:uncharacterized protein YjbI with pentapeptide repeats
MCSDKHYSDLDKSLLMVLVGKGLQVGDVSSLDLHLSGMNLSGMNLSDTNLLDMNWADTKLSGMPKQSMLVALVQLFRRVDLGKSTWVDVLGLMRFSRRYD